MPKKGQPLSEEHKRKMREGRNQKAREREQKQEKQVDSAPYSEPFQLPPGDDDDALLHRLDDVLTDEEIAQIYAEAKLKVRAEQKTARKRELLAKAMDAERREAGVMPVDEVRQKWLDEMEDVYINMPTYRSPQGGETPPEPVIIDQRLFSHGRMYQVTRAEKMTINEVMGRAWTLAAQVDGRVRTYYNAQMGRSMYMGGAAGTGFGKPVLGFDQLHKRPV